jgi:hypothetical protein
MSIQTVTSVAASELHVEQSAGQKGGGRLHSATFARRCLDFAGWTFSGAILAFMPKCPACFAAYAAIGTGLGLSITTAAHVRLLLIIVSACSLVFLTVKHARRLIVRVTA